MESQLALEVTCEINFTVTVLTFIDYLIFLKCPSTLTHSPSLSDMLARAVSQIRRNYRMYGVSVVKQRVPVDFCSTLYSPCTLNWST